MKAAFLCCVLLLAGSASCSPVEANDVGLPQWIPDISIPDWVLDLIAELPDSIQTIIDKLPEIIAAIPDILEKLPEIVEQIIDKIPEIIPIILDKLPEIIAQIPALVDRIREALEKIIDKLPELIPIILEKIPEIIDAIPGIIDKIKEALENWEKPDWFPELEKPEWWPEEWPELPEYNTPVPGTPTTVNEHPSIVQIEVGTGPIWAQGCGGSVLTNFHVLSVARCFSGKRFDTRFRRVRAGSSTRYSGGSVVEVDRVANHPSFGTGDISFEGDITVVRLRSPLLLSATIQQTPIVPSGFILPAGMSVTNVGWGSTAQGKLIADRDLYKIDLAIIANTECQSSWSKFPILNFGVSDNMICAGRPETGGRNGDLRDVGTPVYYDNILVGLLTFSSPGGNEQLPVVATAVSSYTNWVVENAV